MSVLTSRDEEKEKWERKKKRWRVFSDRVREEGGETIEILNTVINLIPERKVPSGYEIETVKKNLKDPSCSKKSLNKEKSMGDHGNLLQSYEIMEAAKGNTVSDYTAIVPDNDFTLDHNTQIKHLTTPSQFNSLVSNNLDSPTNENTAERLLLLQTKNDVVDDGVAVVSEVVALCPSFEPEKESPSLLITNLSHDPYTDLDATKVVVEVDPCKESENTRKISENKNKNEQKQQQKQQISQQTTKKNNDDNVFDGNGKLMEKISQCDENKHLDEQTDYRGLGARPKLKMEKYKRLKEKLPKDLKYWKKLKKVEKS